MFIKEVKKDEDLQSCMDQQQVLEVWIDGALEERCLIVSFNEKTIKTNQGFYYPRSNIILLKGKETEIYHLNSIRKESKQA